MKSFPEDEISRSFMLPSSVAADLRRVAYESNTTQKAVVIEALRRYVDKHDRNPVRMTP